MRTRAKLKLALPNGQYGAQWLDPLSGNLVGPLRIGDAQGLWELEYREDMALAITKT